jgi:DNA gyrase/topoisomerase IV subunit A
MRGRRAANRRFDSRRRGRHHGDKRRLHQAHAVSIYSKQGRGGKGRLGAKAKNEDFVEHLFIASTHASLMIFTDDGQVFKMKVHEIPEADPSARGKAVVNLVQLSSERKLVAVMPVRDFSEKSYLTMMHKSRESSKNRRLRIIKTFASPASTLSTSTMATNCST